MCRLDHIIPGQQPHGPTRHDDRSVLREFWNCAHRDMRAARDNVHGWLKRDDDLNTYRIVGACLLAGLILAACASEPQVAAVAVSSVRG